MGWRPPETLLLASGRVLSPESAGICRVSALAGEHVLDVERARIAAPPQIIDNATIEAYNSDSKHRITKDAHV